jgi:hypothetical protein
MTLSILGRILTLLACVPMLLPSGFCACKAGDAGGTPPPANASRAITPPPSHKTEGCSHRHAVRDHNPAVAPGEPPTRPAPVPCEDHHSPGCPAASPAVERIQWSETTPGTTTVLLLLPFVLAVLAPAANARPPVDRPFSNWPSSPPLYLSHCSLVI